MNAMNGMQCIYNETLWSWTQTLPNHDSKKILKLIVLLLIQKCPYCLTNSNFSTFIFHISNWLAPSELHCTFLFSQISTSIFYCSCPYPFYHVVLYFLTKVMKESFSNIFINLSFIISNSTITKMHYTFLQQECRKK